jgi:hypothetical protein
VRGAVPEDCLVLAFAVLAPEMYAFLVAAFEGFAGDECFGVVEGFG